MIMWMEHNFLQQTTARSHPQDHSPMYRHNRFPGPEENNRRDIREPSFRPEMPLRDDRHPHPQMEASHYGNYDRLHPDQAGVLPMPDQRSPDFHPMRPPEFTQNKYDMDYGSEAGLLDLPDMDTFRPPGPGRPSMPPRDFVDRQNEMFGREGV